ncbi:MAG TPA: phosphatidate cytidylyltransferase [Acidobacteriota bacterium]|jgi:phosphatidate cytidylyltransferase|nr:phosphatidate cytidylyltransferase [Acidobacteriota bacterium]HRR56857.1 phosphatidate cytidylyltransferase [Acidobacteriota bacterium]HRV08031.1 phosphatidate cytidylyltransferase [Acidobacteriota bacterium]
MIQRLLTAGLLIPLVLAVIYLAPFWLFLVVLTALQWVALAEFRAIARGYGMHLKCMAWPAALLLPVVDSFRPEAMGAYLILVLLVICGYEVLTTPRVEFALPNWSTNLAAVAILGCPFLLLARLHPRSPFREAGDFGPHELLTVLTMVWISDAAAYFVGKRMGRRRVLVHISPKKTVEGFLAGLFVPPLLMGWLWPWPIGGGGPVGFMLVVLAVAAAGILGDLLESLWKRGAGVKDSSNLLPGHGGLLDRMDSLLLAVPAYCLCRAVC